MNVFPHYKNGDGFIMSHPIYTEQELSKLKLQLVKQIAAELGVTPIGDKRVFENWVNAIVAHQASQVEKVDSPDDNQPATLPQVGDTHIIHSFLLRCAYSASGDGEHAAVFDCFDGDKLMGEVVMDWNCTWLHSMSFTIFATPQEAVIDLYDSLNAYKGELRSENDVTFTDTDGCHNFEARVKGIAIAELPIDPFNHEQPWYVTVSGFEIYRAALWCEAANWVRERYVAGVLPKHQPQKVQVLGERTSLDHLLDKPFDQLAPWESERVKNYSDDYESTVAA